MFVDDKLWFLLAVVAQDSLDGAEDLAEESVIAAFVNAALTA